MPINMNFSFNFGVILLFLFFFLLLTGFLCVLFFMNSLELSFFYLIMNNLNIFNYFFLSVIHNTMANLFFLFIFLHILSSWLFTSYNNYIVLLSGLMIFIVCCAMAFFGYCLPMGQMSFWAAMVIFSLLTMLPFGNLMIMYIFGSFSMSTSTISLLFFLHFITPFILMLLMIIHLILLHINLSSNTNYCDYLDLVTFLLFFMFMDIFMVIVSVTFIFLMIYFWGYFFFESSNFMSFNSLVTPIHIYPDWFLLFPYACLSSVDSKLYGVLLLIMILLAVFFSPLFLAYFSFSILLNYLHIIVFFFFILLTFMGSHPSVYPYSIFMIYFQFILYFIYMIYFMFILIFYKF